MPQRSDSTTDTGAESFDRLFTLLSNEQRRRVLSYLDGKDGDVATVAELTDHVEFHGTESDGDAGDEVAIALYHTHLPQLAEAGLVEYDEEGHTVRYTGDPRIEPYLPVERRESA